MKLPTLDEKTKRELKSLKEFYSPEDIFLFLEELETLCGIAEEKAKEQPDLLRESIYKRRINNMYIFAVEESAANESSILIPFIRSDDSRLEELADLYASIFNQGLDPLISAESMELLEELKQYQSEDSINMFLRSMDETCTAGERYWHKEQGEELSAKKKTDVRREFYNSNIKNMVEAEREFKEHKPYEAPTRQWIDNFVKVAYGELLR